MSNLEIPSGSPFDAIKHTDERGDHWFGRELMKLMAYTNWRQFHESIDKAKAAAAAVGADIPSNFEDSLKNAGQRGRNGQDYRLTRYAAYLVAMNGDARKPEVAAAQTYFAVLTHEAEMSRAAAKQAVTKVSNRELAAMVIEEADRADRAEVRAIAAESTVKEIEGGDGLTPTAFHKKYFSDVRERDFFEHLYRKNYLLDQRGKGAWSEKKQRRKDGSEHRHPSFKGKAFFYLHFGGTYGDKRREHTRVRPGTPELALKAALIKDGLPANPHLTGLFALEGGVS